MPGGKVEPKHAKVPEKPPTLETQVRSAVFKAKRWVSKRIVGNNWVATA